jgi:hypothetical protein
MKLLVNVEVDVVSLGGRAPLDSQQTVPLWCGVPTSPVKHASTF